MTIAHIPPTAADLAEYAATLADVYATPAEHHTIAVRLLAEVHRLLPFAAAVGCPDCGFTDCPDCPGCMACEGGACTTCGAGVPEAYLAELDERHATAPAPIVGAPVQLQSDVALEELRLKLGGRQYLDDHGDPLIDA